MTPTEKQVSSLRQLTTDALVSKALEAMHALNRRAKEKRDRANTFRRQRFSEAVRDEIEAIYSLKNTFMHALVNADRAQVFVFYEKRHAAQEWECARCDRSWRGPDGECRRCGDYGEQVSKGEEYDQPWYVIESEGFRFHQPDEYAHGKMVEIAVETDAHNPDQPQREIPKVGLTIQAQHECVRLAIERLKPDGGTA